MEKKIHRDIWKVPSTTRVEYAPINYIASDGKVFTDKVRYGIHQQRLDQLRMQWYDERFSLWGMFRYWLNKHEPVKPYKF